MKSPTSTKQTSGSSGASRRAARSLRPPVVSTSVRSPCASMTSIACPTLARHAAVENGRTMPVVPRIEMPPTMPRRGFDVRRAIFSPPGTLTSTTTPTSSVSKTSATAAAICARGPALMAGPPTSRPRPGLVTVPTPGPPRSSMPGASRSVTRAVRWAPWVTSGSSPASLTTTAIAPSPSSSQRSSANDGR